MKDLTGMVFGRLTVEGRGEDYVSPKGNHVVRWRCKCECGNTNLVQTVSLLRGKSKSCGCLQKELASEKARGSGYKLAADIAGQKFGRLTAIRRVGHRDGYGYLWLCRCDCGNETTVPVKMLRSGNTKSCGCLRKDKISSVSKKHGESHKSRLYHVWVGMRQRCNDKNHKSYCNYGGRGITVCKEWDQFSSFMQWALKNGYREDAEYGDCTIDRINVNGNYEPSNCRWVNAAVQSLNKRTR